MKAVVYENFSQRPAVLSMPDPTPERHGVVVKVMATGLCRSDWHGWMGHDADIELPHIPGHELAGTVEAVGQDVRQWKVGDRVTVPFVGGCGSCEQCYSGNHQVCDWQFQPGFTHWGSFAEFVAIHFADTNLVGLPDEVEYSTAAMLGCRFATSWRAVVDQGCLAPGQWVAVHGCGGVGLSAIMIANAMGARTIAIDINDKALAMATKLGAVATINAVTSQNIGEDVKEISDGGAHISIEAIGDPDACYASVNSLRKRGRHIQVGLMDAQDRAPTIPMAKVIAYELELLGSHGMQAHRYGDMIAMIKAGLLLPQDLITRRIGLEQSVEALVNMGKSNSLGCTVIDRF